MNSLIILPAECVDPHVARLVGARARYAREVHGLRQGQSVKAACLGGLRGEARVVLVSSDVVELELSLNLPPLDPFPADLIVGLSRPQTVRKVIQAGVMLGVQSMHFVRSERGEKSYLSSTALEDQALEEETLKALEQIWDSRAPQVRVHRTFSYFVQHHLAPLLGSGDCRGQGILAHPGAEPVRSSLVSTHSRFVLAIGPERGWSAEEVQSFTDAGFVAIGLGPRVLRVELAVTLLLGQLSALAHS